ncbi:hypothetical protein EON81_22840 [bacterium]|nr:MAG: hypothetical protein EON81_22840 [bacterium]
MKILGVDPGREGGVALVGPENYEALPLRYEGDRVCMNTLAALVSEWQPDQVWIEVPQSRPSGSEGNGRSSGLSYGLMLGYFWARGIPVHEVHPQRWKRTMGVTAEKTTSIAEAARRFPNVALVLPRRRRAHDGMAEALLIAAYGRGQS